MYKTLHKMYHYNTLIEGHYRSAAFPLIVILWITTQECLHNQTPVFINTGG